MPEATEESAAFEDEFIANWYRTFWELNPRKRKFKDLVVEYSANAGMPDQAFIHYRWRHFFGGGSSMTVEEAAALSGITLEDANAVFVRMLDAIWPSYEASPEFQAQASAAALDFPVATCDDGCC